MLRAIVRSSAIVLLVSLVFFAGCSSNQGTRPEVTSQQVLESVKAGQFDTGKMWTFDFPPVDYFKKTYGFTPDKAWFDKARLGTLRLPGCTASFISEDGLVMSNHHCARGPLAAVAKEGEKFVTDGFYAKTLEEERKAPTYVDQLVTIEDVTSEMQAAFDSGTTDSAKAANRAAKTTQIIARYAAKFKQTTSDSMVFNVYPFYNGGHYSLYGFKRYTDVRLVFAPEEEIAFYGGDPDNFTYPRYDYDLSLFRVYENGKPLKTPNFFPFSKNGAAENEPVFVIGNPGRTARLNTVAQLETARNLSYPFNVAAGSSRLNALNAYVEKNPDKKYENINTIFGIANSLKTTKGELEALRDPIVMAKKADFEKNFRGAVVNNAQLKAKYGDPWGEIATYEKQLQALQGEALPLNVRNWSSTLSLAAGLLDYATGQMDFRGRPAGKPSWPRNYAAEVEKMMLIDQLTYMKKSLGDKNEAFNKLMAGRTPEQAAVALMSSSITGSKEKFEALANAKQDEITKTADVVLDFAKYATARSSELQSQARPVVAKQQPFLQLLGKAMYDVYGTSIPPDASFSLRIADGVVKGYDYNGTIAPIYTTFYGMYDRYHSFGKKDPWNLPARWANPPADFNMSTPINFVATSDIIGGNSGSPVINKNLEVVGLVFDGNIESLPGRFIFDDTKNRTVAVHSSGLMEAMEKIYKMDRIAKEMRFGKIVN
ncbi:MAG: S46 family peptidase [Ignavibacteriales bacterium]|nr:S46 family peptidase [Ignavibacteriales bacterium]